VLPDEEVVPLDFDGRTAEVAGPFDDRLPVGGRVARTVHDADRNARVDGVFQGGRNVRLAHLCGRCQCDDGGEVGGAVGAREQRHRPAETEPEQADAVVPVGRPPDARTCVGSLAAPLVPLAVVEPEAGDVLCGQPIAHCSQPSVGPPAAVFRVWRTGDDRRGGVLGTVERSPDVPSARKQYGVGHVRTGAVRRQEPFDSPAEGVRRACTAFYCPGGKRDGMGILSRASYVIRSKMNALLNRAEDPSQTLDYSYEQLRDQLQDVKRGIADLTTQKKRLEMQKRRLEQNVEKHNEQARKAVEADREDLARQALEKKKNKMSQIEDLETQIADLQNKQDDLLEKKETLQQRIEEFRTKKETMKARYEAAEASARVSEAMTGAGDEMADVGRAIETAEQKTQDMEARAAAMDELEQTGAFENAISDKDQLDRELEQVTTDSAVDAELETLKAEMGNSEAEPEPETSPEADVEPAVEEADVEMDVEPADEVDDAAVEAELEELKEEDSSSK